MAYAELVDVDGKPTVRVNTVWNEKELIRIVPGVKWNPDERVWDMPLGWAQCVILRGVFKENVTFGERLTQWGWDEVNNRVAPALELRGLIDSDDKLDERLYGFQDIGAKFVMMGDTLLADEMGTGKTIQALTALRHLLLRGVDIFPTLVICPNSTKTNWARETAVWFPEATPIVLDGTPAVRRKAFQQWSTAKNPIFIINIEAVRLHSRLAPFGSVRIAKCRECDPKLGDEGLTTSRCESHTKELNQIPFKTVIFDEIHRAKEPKSKQTRAAWAVMHGKTVERRWGLTGTPLANHPGDLWTIMHAIAPYEYPTKSKFVDRYCLSAWNEHGGLDIVGVNPETKKEFFKILDPRFRRMSKALVLDQLPPKVRQFRHVEMGTKQRKAYEEMEQKLITRLADGEILVAPNNLAAQTRLLQLSSSYATIDYVPNKLTSHSECMCVAANLDVHRDGCPDALKVVVTLTEPSPKLDALEEVMDELGKKPLTACAVSRQLIMLAAARMEKAKVPYGLIVGGMPQWERDLALKQFQNGELRILLYTIQAGGTGLTMTRADTQVFLQRSWSMIENKQAEDRVHRIGSEIHESVNIIDLITRGTVEEKQILRLYEKLQRLEEITRDREQLLAAGKSVEHLDAEEARILGSNLGAP